MQLRNDSNSTVYDFVSRKTIEPDQVVDVDDSLSSHYENHPVLHEVGVYVAPVAPVEVPSEPTGEGTEVTEPVEAPVAPGAYVSPFTVTPVEPDEEVNPVTVEDDTDTKEVK
jgi:hypothetical protein